MTAEQFAKKLDGREYLNELTNEEELEAMENGLVVVFGQSDDLIEFRGAINDECGCFDGGDVWFDKEGRFPDDDEMEVLAKYNSPNRFHLIKAFWCKTQTATWTYETDIPHATFKIMEEEDVYCVGIVFNINSLN